MRPVLLQTFIGGTSAACPVIAGMVSLINDARHAAKRPSLGFLNPFLYANPQCFQDITGGKNLYGATKGWDPASGLGTPIFSCLLNAAMQTVSSKVVS
jgi:tripeptidyl-peptidase-1